MGWVKQSEDLKLPDWLQKELRKDCEYCGWEKENYYNERGECTNRRCPNPECPGTLAHRVADMCEVLGIKGVKEGKGLQLVKEYKLKNHYAALPYIMGEKPKLHLNTFMRVSFIPGIDTAWDGYCAGCNTLDDLVAKSPDNIQLVLKRYLPMLQDGLKYVEIQKQEVFQHKVLLSGNVMLSGNIRGFTDRNDFIYALNIVSEGRTNFRIVGKRKTNVLCLIQEKDEPIRSKAECAMENGIPIMTPKEFLNWCMRKISEKENAEGGD